MAGIELFANQVQTTVSSGGTTAPSAGTVQTWTVASSAGFPAASSSATPPSFFRVTDPALSTEVVLVTNVSGTTWTVTRGAEGTVPVAHAAAFTVENVITAAALALFLQGGPSWVNAVTQYGADPTGTNDSTSAIQAALLSFGTLTGWSQGNGGWVYLPPGIYKTSKPLVIPSGVTLAGAGWGTQISLITGSNCDMIQWSSYNSSSQATVLGVSASTIQNAFWAGLRDICLHGDSFYTTTAGYNHGVNITMNPATSQGGSDPDFDPLPFIQNVRIEAVTGDAYYHLGRSGAYLNRVWAAYCNGNGFTLSFDTTLVDCLAEGTNCGVYMNHGSNVGSGCKSYNNNDNTWVASTAYSPGNVAVSAGVMYFCILAVSGSTAPASDPTHWTALTGATSPQANGYDWYWDTGVAGHNWAAIESQESSKGGFYFKGPNAGSIMVTGQSADVNFNNGQASYNSSNPNHYAAVTLDGVSNVHVNLNSSAQGGGSGIICTSLNSPGQNTLIATTDGTEASVFNGGTPGFALVNGVVQSELTVSAGSASAPAVLAENPTATQYIPAFHAFGPNATTGNFVIFRVGAGLAGSSAEFAFVNSSPRAFILGFNGGPQALVYDDTGKVWTGTYGTPKNVLDDGSGNATFTGSVTAGGGAVNAEQFTALTTPYTLASGTALQKLFNASSNGALTVAASTTYEFECQFDISSSASGGLSFGFGGTATLTSVKYTAMTQKATTLTTPTTPSLVEGTAAAAQALVATTAAGTAATAKIRGVIRVNAGGTLIPEVALGVSTTTAAVGTNSFFRAWPVGSNTVTTVGSWS